MEKQFRPPTEKERTLWQSYREWCLSHKTPDPGPVPDQWPIDPTLAGHAYRVLSNALVSGETEMRRVDDEVAMQSEKEHVSPLSTFSDVPDEVCRMAAELDVRIGPRYVAVYGTEQVGVCVNEGNNVYSLLPPGDQADEVLRHSPDRSHVTHCIVLDRLLKRCWWAPPSDAFQFVQAHVRQRL